MTPLHWAATMSLTTAKLLFEAGRDIHACSSGPASSVLFQAACHQQHEIVEWLISLGVDPSAADEYGLTPLHWATTKNVATVKLLHKAGGNIHACSKTGCNVLFQAVSNEDYKITEWLLSQGADHTAADEDGWTPFHMAAAEDLATAKLLYEAGANIHACSKNNCSILHAAASTGQYDTVKWLLSRGADHSVTDINGWTPLYGAVTKDLATAKLLYEAKAEIHTCTKDGLTLLHLAAGDGQHEIVEWLITLGLDVNAFDSVMETPLHRAARNGHHDTTKALLCTKTQVNVQNSFGQTPLHLASQDCRKPSIVDLSRSYGADLHCVDGYGKSSLDSIRSDRKLFESVQDLPTDFIETDSIAQDRRLRQSIRELTTRLIDDCADFSQPECYKLGHCLLFLDQETEAQCAFERRIHPSVNASQIAAQVICNRCRRYPIVGTWQVCKTCPNMDLCKECFAKYDSETSLRVCAGHDFLAVPGPGWTGHDAPFVNPSQETEMAWLQRIQANFGNYESTEE